MNHPWTGPALPAVRPLRMRGMKFPLRIALLLLLASTGCSWVPYAIHNLAAAPVDEITECVFRDRLHERARTAWQEIQVHEPGPFSKAYVQGFEAGFVDFIDRDGTGGPPAMPPPYLRRAVVRSPAGQDAVNDW